MSGKKAENTDPMAATPEAPNTANTANTANIAAQAAPETDAEEGGFDFAAFSDDDLGVDDDDDSDDGNDGAGAGNEEAPPSADAGQPPASDDKKEPAEAGATPPVQEAKTEETPTAPQPAPPASEPQQPPQEQDLNAQYRQFFDQSVERLTNEVYRLDDATKEKLDTNPSEVIPQLAATLHMQVLTATVTQLANLLPSMVPQIVDRQSLARSNETEFFDRFPKLRDHRAEVEKIAMVYRNTYPDADREKAMREIGAMAMVAMQIPFDTPPQEAAGVPVPPPVVPTSAQGGAPSPSVPGQKTTWDELINEEY